MIGIRLLWRVMKYPAKIHPLNYGHDEDTSKCGVTVDDV